MTSKFLASALLITLLSSSIFFIRVSVSATSIDEWSKPRPTTYRPFNETIGNAYTDGTAAVGLGVYIAEYVESVTGVDMLLLNISASSNTREGIEYNYQKPDIYRWYDVFNPTGISGDDSGVNLTIPVYQDLLPILYYGAEYMQIWICSNGFLSFDCNRNDPAPSAIPNTKDRIL